ncbi:Transmembrane channel-like protein 5 [Galemys pyrenaicus]|uniref:Transmembrane channel-like protein n=1 Tax=Galemys pyrenaicus TaxID=202257 RepID=A0A8J6A3B1_GALPY|nr:Transmembrane channel-like protein 5 [Galemys pyrenaicus]
MSSYYRNYGYEEDPDPDYPDSSTSWNRTQGHWKTQDYPVSLNNPDYPGFSSNPYSSDSRRTSEPPVPLAEPDYPGSRSHPYDPRSPREPDYSVSQWNSDFPGSGRNRNYAGSRANPDYGDSFGEPDYPGAANPRTYSSRESSRRNPDYAGPRISPYLDSGGEPDYPGAENQLNPTNVFGEPDYPGAEDYGNSSNIWGEPDYPDAEDGHDYGSFEMRQVNREMLRRTSSIQPSLHHSAYGPFGRESEDYPDSTEMTSVANLFDRSAPGGPGNGTHRHLDGIGLSHPKQSQLPVRSLEDGPRIVLEEGKMPSDGKAHEIIVEVEEVPSEGQSNSFSSQIVPERMLVNTSFSMASFISDIDRPDSQIFGSQSDKKGKQPLQFPAALTGLFSRPFRAQNVWARTCLVRHVRTFKVARHWGKGYRRSKNILSEVLSSFTLWQKTLKVIGGKFGTSVLSYFNFLRWLLKFNIFSFIVTFSFIIIPQFTQAEKNTLQFTGLEFFTGAGYFEDTVMYYGYYTNSTIQHGGSASYDMPLAYIFTMGVCLVICFFSLLFSMARYFRNNFINPHIYSRGIAKLIFCWDFTVTHEKAVKLKQKNLSTEIRENLSEILQENVKLTLNQQLIRFSAHLAAWVISTGVAVACCTAVYYLAENNLQFLKEHTNPGAVLLLPFVVSCINLAVPRFYSMFRLVERYEIPRHEVYILLIRNIFLKISIIGILCYYWLNVVAPAGEQCWETLIGQEIYRLLLMDFMFSLADSLLGEFLRRLIGMRFIPSLGSQEFDIAGNVLELIYVQTLVWIGTFFCPLLPFIQMITLFIMFYVKNVSLMMNFQPPSKAWRASQMMTLFIFLLFFPSFTGVLCSLAFTIWSLQPSAHCGPFRGLPHIIHSIYGWIDTLSKRPSYLWVVWIYQNLIGSVHFFFILTLIVLIITYLYWQITEGRKIMIRLLHEQIVNEGKDKMFLIEKLTKLQEAEKRANPPSSFMPERRCVKQEDPTIHMEEYDAAHASCLCHYCCCYFLLFCCFSFLFSAGVLVTPPLYAHVYAQVHPHACAHLGLRATLQHVLSLSDATRIALASRLSAVHPTFRLWLWLLQCHLSSPACEHFGCGELDSGPRLAGSELQALLVGRHIG